MVSECPSNLRWLPRTTVTSKTKPQSKSKQTISVASVFKQRAPNTKVLTPKWATNARKVVRDDASMEKVSSPKSPSSGHSPKKNRQGEPREPRKQSNVHPLAAAFKETTTAYKANLLEAATAHIDEQFGDLLNQLHQGILWPESSHNADGGNATASTPKLTASARIIREYEKVKRPLGTEHIWYSTVGKADEQEFESDLLQNRMDEFNQQIGKDVQKIKALNAQWEDVVSEIWHLGIHCLGEQAMHSLLVTPPSLDDEPSAQIKHNNSSSLFVPERGSSPPVHSPDTTTALNTETNKRVTFDISHPELPLFLLRPPKSMVGKPALPHLPAVPEKEAKVIEGDIATLGRQQIGELQTIDKEQQTWWSKKAQQITLALNDD